MSHDFGKRRGGSWTLRLGVALAGASLAVCLALTATARGQVAPSAEAGGLAISAGGTGSGFYLQYGERKMLGISGFVDVDTRRRIGVEAEGRWLEFNQTANVHAETYSIGPRYHMNFRKFQPYAKGLVGIGDMNFTYNLGTGSYLVVTAGGGVDYHLSHRIYIRAADIEYQIWPQFTYGGTTSSMTSVGISAGIRVRVF